MPSFGSVHVDLTNRHPVKQTFYMNQRELDAYREHYKDNPEFFEAWVTAHVEIYELMDVDSTLQEMVGKKRGLNQENPNPALNRADRRRLRNRKAR